MSRPSLLHLTAVFLRIGNTTLGGGDPTMAALQRELDLRGWITPEQFSLAYALARITPGTNVIAFCAGAAWLALGFRGAIAAVLAVTIPSSAIVVWLTYVCEMGGRFPALSAALSGAIAAALGTMVAAAYLLIRSQLSKAAWLGPLCVVAAAFLLARWSLSPVQILGLAAAAGLLWRIG